MLAAIALIAALQASPTPASTGTPAGAAPLPSPTPTANPAMEKVARQQFGAFTSGKIDASQYSVAIPKDALAQVQAFLSALGPIQAVDLVQSGKINGDAIYVYRFTCQNGAALEQLSVKPNGKIDGIYFRPVQQ